MLFDTDAPYLLQIADDNLRLNIDSRRREPHIVTVPHGGVRLDQQKLPGSTARPRRHSMLRFITSIDTAMTDLRANLRTRASRLLTDTDGATAIEYGLIAAGIAVAILAAVFALGDEIKNFFTGVQKQMQSKAPG
jgi:pilus assembly protein Flp/PilA